MPDADVWTVPAGPAANIASEIIEKSENDAMTPADVDAYAKRFQDLLGDNAGNPLKDDAPPRNPPGK